MSGPLHGGAPARVIPMIEDVERSGDARAVVKGILDRKDKLMGFGHRVYRAEDPRARVLRATAKRLQAPRYEVAAELEKAAAGKDPDGEILDHLGVGAQGLLEEQAVWTEKCMGCGACEVKCSTALRAAA